MSVVKSTNEIQKWFYTVNEILIRSGDDEMIIPSERITHMSLKCLYESNMFPVFSITVVLESSKYFTILKNKKKSTFKLNVSKSFRYNGNEEDSLFRNFINQSFALILDDDDVDSNSTSKRLEASSDYNEMIKKDNNDLYYTDNEVTFYLFPISAIDNAKTTVNAILKNATLQDAVAYILSQAKFNNVLMTPFDNKDKKEIIVIPPMQASKALQFLDTYYGFYKSGAMYFCDFDYFYILKYNYDSQTTAKNENIDVNIIIPDLEADKLGDLCGTLQSSNNTYQIISSATSISIRNNSVSTNAIYGTDVMTIDNYSGDIKNSNVKVETASGTSNKSIIENKTENEWITEIHASQIESQSTVVTITLVDIDISILKPNKRFKIIFEDPLYTDKYKGVFILSEYTAEFVKSGTSLKVSAICSFKRISSK